MPQHDELFKRVLELSREMIILADEGQAAARDDGCRLLYGIIQDCAYKIRMAAEKERQTHQVQDLS